MDNTPWQQRLDALGFSQKDFAALVGLTPSNFSAALRGKGRPAVPQYLRALILALEVMPEGERERWADLARREAETPTPAKPKPK